MTADLLRSPPQFLPRLTGYLGSFTRYRHPAGFTLSEGVYAATVPSGCRWLLDEIARDLPAARRHGWMQVFRLHRSNKGGTVLIATDADYGEILTRTLPLPFPAARIEFWFANEHLYLPSEH